MSRFFACLVYLSTSVICTSSVFAENSSGGENENARGTLLPKDTRVEQAMMLGESGGAVVAGANASLDETDGEEIWVEISGAIEGLNNVVGDRMFLDLRRKNESEMEVRVDVGFWQRVRYQTRVDLKNDISNIWHLYVKQFYDGGASSVRFVDDKTDKTIDIFTQVK